jgi:hypothetical protein
MACTEHSTTAAPSSPTPTQIIALAERLNAGDVAGALAIIVGGGHD